MTTTAINLPTWCQLRAERFRDMEQHEMAMYPDQDCRDVAIVEHVVRVLANPDLPESSEVLAIVAEQHRLELNATGTAGWLTNRVNELTAELAERDTQLAQSRQQAATYANEIGSLKANLERPRAGIERAIKHVQGLLEYIEQGDYRPLAEDEVTNLALDFKAILADLGRPVPDDEDTRSVRAVATVEVPGVTR